MGYTNNLGSRTRNGTRLQRRRHFAICSVSFRVSFHKKHAQSQTKNNVKHGISWEGSDQSTVTLWQSTTEHLGYHLSKYVIIPVLVIQNALNGTMTRNNEPTPSKFSAAPVLSCGKGFITACSKFQLQGLTVQAMQPKVSELQDHPIATIAGWLYMNIY